MVKVLQTKEEFDQLLKDAGNELVVIDFSASWCGPCQMVDPKFHPISQEPENRDVTFAKVDVDENSDTSEACQIEAMPTFQFYRNGKMLADFSGTNETKLREYIAKFR